MLDYMNRSTPKKPSSKAAFVIDEPAVAEAARTLGLRHPVRVFIRAYPSGKGGRYVGLRDGVHHVGVAADLRPKHASRTLWHELTHALQVERLGDDRAFTRLWWQEMADLGIPERDAARANHPRYSQTPLEREATANERRHRQLALAYPRREAPRRRASPLRLLSRRLAAGVGGYSRA